MFRLRVDDLSELRLLEPHHAEEVFAAVEANRSMLRQWLRWVDATKMVDDTHGFIDSSLGKLARQEELTAGTWREDRFAGVIGVDLNHKTPTGELGYWLCAECQGRGLITRTVGALLPYLFQDRKLNRVEIRCASENVRSCAIPKRLGFRLEGTLRQVEHVDGRWVDHHLFALLRSEWLKRDSGSEPELG